MFFPPDHRQTTQPRPGAGSRYPATLHYWGHQARPGVKLSSLPTCVGGLKRDTVTCWGFTTALYFWPSVSGQVWPAVQCCPDCGLSEPGLTIQIVFTHSRNQVLRSSARPTSICLAFRRQAMLTGRAQLLSPHHWSSEHKLQTQTAVTRSCMQTGNVNVRFATLVQKHESSNPN